MDFVGASLYSCLENIKIGSGSATGSFIASRLACCLGVFLLKNQLTIQNFLLGQFWCHLEEDVMVGRSVIISYEGGKLHHDPMGALVSLSTVSVKPS